MQQCDPLKVHSSFSIFKFRTVRIIA